MDPRNSSRVFRTYVYGVLARGGAKTVLFFSLFGDFAAYICVVSSAPLCRRFDLRVSSGALVWHHQGDKLMVQKNCSKLKFPVFAETGFNTAYAHGGERNMVGFGMVVFSPICASRRAHHESRGNSRPALLAACAYAAFIFFSALSPSDLRLHSGG